MAPGKQRLCRFSTSEMARNRVAETNNSNPEIERCFLGALFLFPANIEEARGIVTPEMLIYPVNRKIFSAMCSISDRGREPDMVTIRFMLRQSKEMEDAGGPVYFSDLMQTVPSSGRWEIWAGQVAEEFRRRKVGEVLAHSLAARLDNPPDLLAAQTIQELEAVMRGASTLPKSLRDIAEESRTRQAVPRISTGFHQLDEYLCGGFGEGRFIIIAAGTSVGKSQLVVNFCSKMEKDGRPARSLYVCQEMTTEEILVRFVALFGEVNNQSVEVILQKREQQETIDLHGQRYSVGFEKAQGAQILVEAEGQITGARLRAMAAQKYIWPDGQTCRAEVIILDYIQQCAMDGEDSLREMINSVSLTCKNIARRYRIPVIAVSQLNRLAAGDRPSLWHLKETGNLENDADTVILLWRPKKKDEIEEVLECDLAKNRGGPLGLWKSDYILSTGEIRCIPGA